MAAQTAPGPQLFSASYSLARQRLLQAAAARGLSVETHPHPSPGLQGEALALDVVRDGPLDARKVLLLTSAVHGVEGHCGSGVQLGLLTLRAGLQAQAGPDVAIVHVHAVNPYGFSHGRRVTHENVDLNRNFVDFAKPLPVDSATHRDYAQVHPLLLPATWPPSADNEARLDALRQGWGPRRYQLAVTAGQHTHADGVFYGGIGPTWSNRIFRDVLRRQAAAASRLAWIDLHTGLGLYGVGERIFACVDGGVTLDRAKRWWGERITSVQTGTSTSIPMTGPIQMAVDDECPHVEYTGICLEFGTEPAPAMHAALRAEHWLHVHPDAPDAVANPIRQRLRDVFYPDRDDWKEAIWAQALEASEQAVKGLCEP
jgi:hypothetical protein